MRVLLVGGAFHSRGVLAAARALGAAGWTVGIAGALDDDPAAVSRWTSAWHRIPAPEESVERFVDGVATAVRRGGYDVVLPAGDAEALTLSAARGQLPSGAVPYGPHQGVVDCFDKARLHEQAIAAGVAVPHTRPGTAEALEAFPGPVAVKARSHWSAEVDSPPRVLGTTIFDDRAAAVACMARMHDMGVETLVQEVLRGCLVALAVVRTPDGRIVGVSQQRSFRLWPGPTGISARAETTAVDSTLLVGIEALLGRLEWRGLAQAQFIDVGDGQPRLIDLNGRLYGSIALAIAAGADLAGMWADTATGQVVDAPLVARAGVRYQWLFGDLLRARGERRGGLPADVFSCMWYAPGAVHGTWDRHDPRPALRSLRQVSGRAVRKIVR